MTPTNITLSNARSLKDLTSDPHRGHHQRENSGVGPSPFNNNQALYNPQLENKVNALDDTVRNLTSKTNMLEEQVRSLCEVIESMRREKFDLEKVRRCGRIQQSLRWHFLGCKQGLK